MDSSFRPRLDPLSTLYSERYAVYLANADKQKMLDWVSEKFDEEICSHLMNKELYDGKLSVLGIGSGNGKFEVQMLMQLMKKFRFIECTVVEPSAERIASYKKLAEEKKDALNNVAFEWRQETIQEFCKANADGSKKFHLTSAIHSLYTVPRQDLDYCINAAIRWTEGKVLIMQDAETSLSGHLEKVFSSEISSLQPLILGNTIMESLKNAGIAFETSALPCELDVTSCFDDDSKDGKLLLEFLVEVVTWVDDGPPELLTMVRKFLKSEGISYTKNGRIFVAHPTQVIIVST